MAAHIVQFTQVVHSAQVIQSTQVEIPESKLWFDLRGFSAFEKHIVPGLGAKIVGTTVAGHKHELWWSENTIDEMLEKLNVHPQEPKFTVADCHKPVIQILHRNQIMYKTVGTDKGFVRFNSDHEALHEYYAATGTT